MNVKSMEQELEQLCILFDNDLERQENILAVCMAQGKAARAHDLEYLEAKTAALNALIRDAVDAERERLELVRRLVDAYQLTPERQTLSDLIAIAPDPWKTRLREFQTRMKHVLMDTRQVVHGNTQVIRRSLGVVNEAMKTLLDCLPSTPGNYDGKGEEIGSMAANPAMIDTRG